MQMRSLWSAFALAFIALLPVGQHTARAQTTVSVGVTNDFGGWNPYAEITSVVFMIWCQTYGCLGVMDAKTGEFRGVLAERWEVNKDNPTEWTFHLRRGLKRHIDGKELTAEDVVHSVWRNKNDPRTAQSDATSEIAEAIAVDKYTVRFVTKTPDAGLLYSVFDRLIITSKDLWDKHGAQADRKAPWGWGPYVLKDFVVGRQVVIEKNPNWPGIRAENPDRLVFRLIYEDEVRTAALLNGELQIAAFIPPHLMAQVERAPNVVIRSTPSPQIMFLGMNLKHKPWDNKLVRQAVAYAIDRKAIAKNILFDSVDMLEGPIGPGQVGYSPDVTPKPVYDPEKAKQLLVEAGYPNGVEIVFNASNSRYPYDRQLTQAMVPMLEAVGFKVKYQSVDWPTYWADIRRGKQAFYYQGRSSVIDPSQFMAQYFGTGRTPRIGYSDPELDRILVAERAEFDLEKRNELLLKAFNHLQENVPAVFLWRSRMNYGVSKKLDFTPIPTEAVYGTEILVKN